MSDKLRKAAQELDAVMKGPINEAAMYRAIEAVQAALAALPPEPSREVTQEQVEAFERWALARRLVIVPATDKSYRYLWSNTEDSWHAWQAAHAAGFEAGRKDADRYLHFLAKHDAFIHTEPAKPPYPVLYQIWSQDEDEEFHIISGVGRFFSTPAEAIDAAMHEDKS